MKQLNQGYYRAIERDWSFVIRSSDTAIIYRENRAMGVIRQDKLRFTPNCRNPNNRVIARALADVHLHIRSELW